MPLINANGERVHPPYIIDGVCHPDDIEFRWSGAELAKIGLSVEPHVDAVPDELDLTSYASQKRWEKEIGGMIFDGIPIATDDRSKLLIMNASIRAMSDAKLIERWVAMDGSVHDFDAQKITELNSALANHISKCFAIYSIIKDGIEDGSLTDKEEINAAFEF